MADSDDRGDGVPDNEAGAWLAEIARAQKDMDQYYRQCDRIKKKYIYENSKNKSRRRYAMLWANTEVLKPSIYARCPAPAVSSRFKTGDAVARTAGMLLERSLDFQFDACDYDSSFRAIRDDYLLYGRGVPRLRYEPTFEKTEIETGESGEDASGQPDAEDQDAAPDETISFETVKLDFVDRRDFIHPKTRRWQELPWVGYRAFLTKRELTKRWGEKIASAVEFGKTKDDNSASGEDDGSSDSEKATVYEIWDKENAEVLWLIKGYPEIVERGAPYLKFEGFYPSPRPAYATLTNDSLIPRPDYVFYQDQAEEIDDLTARIAALTDSLKLVGFYPAGPQGEGSPEIEQAVRPDFENRMVAVKAWDMFRQGGGGGGAPIIWLPTDQVAKVIESCIKLRKELVDDVFQITGIADIMRGDTDAEETAAAQGLKAQWGNVRLRERQKEIARIARDVTRMAAEVIANHFQVSTLCQIADMPLPTDADVQQMQAQFQQAQAAFQAQAKQAAASIPAQPPGPPGATPPAPPPGGQPAPKPPEWQDPGPTQERVEKLLRDNVARRFLIDIEADSTIAADEAADQKRRTEFIAEAGKFIVTMLPVIQEAPAAAPFIGALFMFGIRAFPAARELEGEADKMIDKLTAMAGQPKPPNVDDQKAQADAAKSQAEIAKAKIGMQTEQLRAQAEIQKSQIDAQTAVRDHELELQSHQMEMDRMTREHQMSMAQNSAKQQTLAQTVRAQEEKFAARDALSMFKQGRPQ